MLLLLLAVGVPIVLELFVIELFVLFVLTSVGTIDGLFSTSLG